MHVNSLLLQDILSEEKCQKRLTDADRRALPPLFWTHVNPHGRFELDMNHTSPSLPQRPWCQAPAPCPRWKPPDRRRTVGRGRHPEDPPARRRSRSAG
ncbi:hypothetical protein [Streptomyces sp. bgisy031]|uniref:hypothetical protein n=1 Tax=Streptomyces sp. bgisy031 TaxID=3413772 RepID=UPI003D71AAAE